MSITGVNTTRLGKAQAEIREAFAELIQRTGEPALYRLEALLMEALEAAQEQEQERCAHAVCPACRRGYAVQQRPDGTVDYEHVASGGLAIGERCRASAIRDRWAR